LDKKKVFKHALLQEEYAFHKQFKQLIVKEKATLGGF
jgi:hypothetical protein